MAGADHLQHIEGGVLLLSLLYMPTVDVLAMARCSRWSRDMIFSACAGQFWQVACGVGTVNAGNLIWLHGLGGLKAVCRFLSTSRDVTWLGGLVLTPTALPLLTDAFASLDGSSIFAGLWTLELERAQWRSRPLRLAWEYIGFGGHLPFNVHLVASRNGCEMQFAWEVNFVGETLQEHLDLIEMELHGYVMLQQSGDEASLITVGTSGAGMTPWAPTSLGHIPSRWTPVKGEMILAVLCVVFRCMGEEHVVTLRSERSASGKGVADAHKV